MSNPVRDTSPNERLVPLEGGSNFRDMGGYPTEDGRQVKWGLLFRSGSMTGLTLDDKTKLSRMGFKSVIDLRSNDEVALLPNTWATASVPNYLQHPYPMAEMEAAVLRRSGQNDTEGYERIYPYLHSLLKPQLLQYFDALTQGEVPIVVNCTAGQDRTGVAAAIMLRALGVAREVIYQDYLLSPELRRPTNEWGDVDIEEAARTNDFAAAMLKNRDGLRHDKSNPLTTQDGTPFLELSFQAIDKEHGNFDKYLANELRIDSQARDHICNMYVG